MIHPVTENYPLSIANIVNKPLLCYQLEYLQRYGVNTIHILVERKYSHKVEKYLKTYYQPENPEKCQIDLVVFQDEEETGNALKKLTPKLYTDAIVLEGDTLLDIPLDEALDTHYMSGASITAILKEFDMKKGGKGPKLADVEQSEIFGLSSWTPEQIRLTK